MMRSNSLSAYASIADQLPMSRSAVYRAILARGSISRQGVSDHLGWPINRVTGRISELLQSGQIIESGAEFVEGRTRALLSVNPDFKVAA